MKKLVAVFMVPGIVFWFIHTAIGDPYLFSIGIVPDNIVPNSLKVLHGEYYLKYPLSLNLSSFLGQTVYRLLGPYDEPGVIGTLAALILSADNFRLNSKSNLILIIAGILSFSLTFYILTVLYFFLKGALRPKMFLIFAAILTFMYIVGNKVEYFSSSVLDRIQISESGTFVGDNRVHSGLADGFSDWLTGDVSVLLFGSKSRIDDGSSSWKRIPVEAGALGLLAFIWVLNSFVRRFSPKLDYAAFCFVIVFCASIYQRPDIIKPAYLIIFSAGLVLSKRQFFVPKKRLIKLFVRSFK